MRKALLGFISVCFVLIILGVAAGAYLYQDLYKKFEAQGPLAEEKLVLIPSGSSALKVANILAGEGVIADPEAYYWTLRLEKKATDLKAGEYAFTPGITGRAVMDMLVAGKTFQRKVTIREGLTSYEVIRLLNSVEGLAGAEIAEIPPEGTLLPETYLYQKGETRADIVQRMKTDFAKHLDQLWESRAADLPIETKEEALILASIIEKETGKPGEHKKVAGVFVNRLRVGMPLQTDPTVIYAITQGRHENEGQGPLGRRLLRKDLEFESPYNTYLNAGLPPGPIANPGLASLEAALNPEAHDYLYFVADGKGGHAFGKTLAEHNANVAKWRKIRRVQGR